jgi:hypothetical protein
MFCIKCICDELISDIDKILPDLFDRMDLLCKMVDCKEICIAFPSRIQSKYWDLIRDNLETLLNHCYEIYTEISQIINIDNQYSKRTANDFHQIYIMIFHFVKNVKYYYPKTKLLDN